MLAPGRVGSVGAGIRQYALVRYGIPLLVTAPSRVDADAPPGVIILLGIGMIVIALANYRLLDRSWPGNPDEA